MRHSYCRYSISYCNLHSFLDQRHRLSTAVYTAVSKCTNTKQDISEPSFQPISFPTSDTTLHLPTPIIYQSPTSQSPKIPKSHVHIQYSHFLPLNFLRYLDLPPTTLLPIPIHYSYSLPTSQSMQGDIAETKQGTLCLMD